MKIVSIVKDKTVKRSKRQYAKALKEIGRDDPLTNQLCMFKHVPLKEPVYIVEMSNKEFQLISFYLELERREPITKIKLDTELESGGEKE